MWQTVFGAIAAVALASQSPQFSISGAVRFAGEPVPGVTVTVSSTQVSRTAVTGPAGEYQVANLAEGPHRVTTALPGFRDQKTEVVLTRDVELDFELELRVLVEVLPVGPSPAEAFRQADDIVRLRLERERPPEPCGQIVTAFYDANVIESVKGPFPGRIRFGVDSAGTCLEGTDLVKGMNQAPESGEYIVLLRREGNHFESVAGQGSMFPIENESVLTGGYDGLPPRMALAEFYAAARSRAR